MPDCPCDRCHEQRNYIRRLIDYGRYNRIRPESVMPVLDMMMALGYDGRTIASAVGVPFDTGCHWVRMRRKGRLLKLGHKTCAMILAAGEPTDGRYGQWACDIAARKLQALARIGWGGKEIGRMIAEQGLWHGSPRGLLFNYRGGHGPYIQVRLFKAINTIYEQLNFTPAPADRWSDTVRRQAAIKRWASPLAWDDIDDPSARPVGVLGDRRDDTKHYDSYDELVVALLVAGRKKGINATTAERHAVVRILRERGKTDGEIERITGITQIKWRYPVAAGKES